MQMADTDFTRDRRKVSGGIVAGVFDIEGHANG